LDRVQDAAGHVLEGGFDGGGGLAAGDQAVDPLSLLDEDGLGRGRAAVGGEDGANLGLGGHAGPLSLPRPRRSARSARRAARRRSASRSMVWVRASRFARSSRSRANRSYSG